jgi:hypothetical protein
MVRSAMFFFTACSTDSLRSWSYSPELLCCLPCIKTIPRVLRPCPNGVEWREKYLEILTEEKRLSRLTSTTSGQCVEYLFCSYGAQVDDSLNEIRQSITSGQCRPLFSDHSVLLLAILRSAFSLEE